MNRRSCLVGLALLLVVVLAIGLPVGLLLFAQPPSLVEPFSAPARVDAVPCVEDLPVPVVAVRVRVAPCAAPGQELVYTICVENQSQAAAHHVLVRNPLPQHARFVRAEPPPTSQQPELVWSLGTLAPCACKTITLVLSPTGTGDIENCARVQFEHGQCVCTRIVRPELDVCKSGPHQAILYDVLKYCIKVTNTGAVAVNGVRLTDTLPPQLEHASGQTKLTWDIGRLGPGESRCVEYEVVAKGVGRFCNRTVATAEGGLRKEAESCVEVGEAKLQMSKTGPAQRYVNLPATYLITVVNSGSAPLQDVIITDTIPAGLTFLRASEGGQFLPQPQPAETTGTVQWRIPLLGAGQSKTVELVLRADRTGRFCNRAKAQAGRGLTAEGEVCTDFLGVSALLLEVVDLDDPVEVGAETRYVIIVRNQGTERATNVRIQALAPKQMAIVRVTGPADHKKEGQRVLFFPLQLQPQGEARYEVYTKMLEPGDVRFQVEMTADQLKSGPVREQESTTIYRDIRNR
ncbi:MAG: hypothetical protein KatS3mg105_1087 [Gemmatales bacterium]|nr:MAG: hypothetical protein KatS3mg105_1087 [Gemmatales bacterium]